MGVDAHPDVVTTNPEAPRSAGAGPSVVIACQGGGSHTAFTAGVLARLLEAPELAEHRIVGLSGTSGGAVCAVLAWSALLDGDRARAGRVLEEFWADNAATGLVDSILNVAMLAASTAQSFGIMPTISPYQVPFASIGVDYFRQMLERHVDFDRIDVDVDALHPLLLLGAVEVRSGRFRAFNSHRDRITADMVLASAAIPNLFPAVPVEGGLYWDGLFSQNPPVRELLDARPDELWVLQVNPRERATDPVTVLDIADRRNELSGNLSLYQELAFVEKIDQLLESGQLASDGRYKQVVVRVIEPPRAAVDGGVGPASKLNRDPAFLESLIAHGRNQAEVFLAALGLERAWIARDVDAIMRGCSDDAELVSRAPFPRQEATRDRRQVRQFLLDHLCEGIEIDPAHKQIAGDRVTWSVRMRRADSVVEGAAVTEISGGGVVKLALGPSRD